MSEKKINDYQVKKEEKPTVIYTEQEEVFITPDNESEEEYNTSGHNK